MNPEWLIIDGYNLLHQHEELARLLRSDIMTARHRLVRLIESTALRMASRTTVVFDGREAGTDAALTTEQMEVFFSPQNLSADSVIERLVCRFPFPERILVVTSDRAEHATVSGAGAQVMSAEEFLARCEADRNRRIAGRTPPGRQPRLGDHFPEGL